MKNFFEGFVLSLGFFTILTFPYKVKNINSKTYKYLALTLPASGLILGAITVFLYHSLTPFADAIYVGVLVSVIYLFLYGFLHLEAVADVIDAYFASHGGKNAREVIKDSHIGALGAVGTFSFMILKVSAICYLLVEGDYLGVVAVLFISRLMAIGAIYSFDFHSESKFIYLLKDAIDKKSLIILAVISLVLLAFLGNLSLLIFAIVLTYLIKRWLMRHIGFLNGDGLGFMIELNEIVLLNLLIFLLN